MRLRDFFRSLFSAQSETWASFRVPPERVLDTDGEAGETDRFVPEGSYLQLRLAQMHLRDRREYWQEFEPVAQFSVELLYAGDWRTVPFVVGPDLLQAASSFENEEHVEYRNIRVVGPYPFVGDQIRLFAGLFRVETDNWARRALSLVESFGKAFDTTKLSSFVSIADPVVDAVQQFFAMGEVEKRFGQLRELSAPPEAEPARTATSHGDTVLRPGFDVWLRRPQSQVADAERRRFWVKEGRLFSGIDRGDLRPFEDADFLLLRTVATTQRGDYTTFRFHVEYWKKVRDHIWGGRTAEAENAFKLLAANLAESEDIIFDHRVRLLAAYRDRFQQEADAYEQYVANPQQGFEARLAPMGQDQLAAALEVAAPPAPPSGPGDRSPERLLSLLGI